MNIENGDDTKLDFFFLDTEEGTSTRKAFNMKVQRTQEINGKKKMRLYNRIHLLKSSGVNIFFFRLKSS